MAGTLTVSGTSAGEAAGGRTFGPISINGSAVIGETLVVSLNSGDNTFAVPIGSVAALIIPPASNLVAVKIRSSLNAADGGLPINPAALPMVYPFPAVAPTTIIVNAASAVASGFTIAFI